MWLPWSRKRRQANTRREKEVAEIYKQIDDIVDETNKKIDTNTRKIVNFNHTFQHEDVAQNVHMALTARRQK